MNEREQQQSAIDARKRVVDVYTATIDRLEPEIGMIDPGAFYASAAISLKRIADLMERHSVTEDETMRIENMLRQLQHMPPSYLYSVLKRSGYEITRRK